MGGVLAVPVDMLTARRLYIHKCFDIRHRPECGGTWTEIN